MECNDNVLRLLPGPVILCVGFLLQIIGLSTTFWFERTGVHTGLWRVCTEDSTKTEACFTISERGNVPTMVFLCSFLCTVSTIIDGLSIATAFLILSQKKSRIIKWSKNSATASLVSVVLSVCVECIYGATYLSINYDNIPNWDDKSASRTLSWSFYVTCVSSFIILIGSLFLITVPSYLFSTNKISTTLPQIPVLQIHPPPSDRTPTPLYLLSQRSSSPLPSPFSNKTNYPHPQSLPPVFTQLRK